MYLVASVRPSVCPSVRPSVCPSVSALTAEPLDLRPWCCPKVTPRSAAWSTRNHLSCYTYGWVSRLLLRVYSQPSNILSSWQLKGDRPHPRDYYRHTDKVHGLVKYKQLHLRKRTALKVLLWLRRLILSWHCTQNKERVLQKGRRAIFENGPPKGHCITTYLTALQRLTSKWSNELLSLLSGMDSGGPAQRVLEVKNFMIMHFYIKPFKPC